MLNLRRTAHVMAIAAAFFAGASVAAETPNSKQVPVEAYIHDGMPSVVHVVGTEVDGAVFADAEGHTLYSWPARGGGEGGGEQKGKPTCDDTRFTKSTGEFDPWPPGLELPDLASRPSCTQLWPPFYAADDAKPAGKWTIVTRKDGKKQWAYDGFAVYTSALDHQPGDVNGGGVLGSGGNGGPARSPISPKPDIPAQFIVQTLPTGRMLTLVGGYSVYTWDKDPANKSVCGDDCLRTFKPVLAAVAAPQSRGDWGVIQRSPGVWQWTFRKKPLYSLIDDEQTRSYHGADNPGWRNVYVQPAPAWPKGFTVQDNPGGQVLADARGKTIYLYNCIDDAPDSQSCDHPSTTQAYRLAICGNFDPKLCAERFPYVQADKNAKSDSHIWAIKDIDPMTGHYVEPGTAGSLHIWTYRDRPIYTFASDEVPGDTRANSFGEGNGWRNGFHAFWIREEFRKQFGGIGR